MSNKKIFSLFEKKTNEKKLNNEKSYDDVFIIGEYSANESKNNYTNNQISSSSTNIKSEKVIDQNTGPILNNSHEVMNNFRVPSIPQNPILDRNYNNSNSDDDNFEHKPKENKTCFVTLAEIKKEIFNDDDNLVNQFFSQEEDVSYDPADESEVFQTSFHNLENPVEDLIENNLLINVDLKRSENIKSEPDFSSNLENDDEEDEDIKLIYQNRAFLEKIDKIIDLTQEDDDDNDDGNLESSYENEDDDGFKLVLNRSKVKQPVNNQEISPIIIAEKQNSTVKNQPQSPLVVFPKNNSSIIILDELETSSSALKTSKDKNMQEVFKKSSKETYKSEEFRSIDLISDLIDSKADTDSNDSDNIKLITISDELEKSYLDKQNDNKTKTKNNLSENSPFSPENIDKSKFIEVNCIDISNLNKEIKSFSETNNTPKKNESNNSNNVQKTPLLDKKNSDGDTQSKVRNLKRLRAIMDESFEEDNEEKDTTNKTIPNSKRRSFSNCLNEIFDGETNKFDDNNKNKEKSNILKHISEKMSTKPPTSRSLYKCSSHEDEITSVLSPQKQNSNSEIKNLTVTGELIGNKRATILIEPLNEANRKRKTTATPNKDQSETPPNKRSSSAVPILQADAKRVFSTNSNDSSCDPVKISKPSNNLNNYKLLTNSVKPSVLKPKPIATSNQASSNDKLNSIDAEKKKYLQTIPIRHPTKSSKPLAKSSKIMEEIKNLRYPINNPKIKTKKVTCPSNDISLTQSMNLAKLENRSRLESILNSTEKQPTTSNALVADNRVEKPQSINAPKLIKINDDIAKRPDKNKNLEQAKSSSVNSSKPLTLEITKQKESIKNNENKNIKINKNKDNTMKEREPIIRAKPKLAHLEKNDVLGNIMGEFNKQVSIAPSASGEKLYKSHDNKYDLKHFLFRVLRWTYSWLNEQEKIGKPPPVVENQELYPMVDKFKSFHDYYNTMFPLLLAETWEEITKSWREQRQNNKSEKRSYSNMPIWLKSTEKVITEEKHASASPNELIQIIFQIVVDPAFKSAPYEDDLLRLKMNLNESKQAKEFDFFAIIKQSKKLKHDEPTIIGGVRDYLRELENKSAQDRSSQMFSSSSPSKSNSSPTCAYDVYEFTVLARYRKYMPKIGEKVDYEFIACLSSMLRRVKALIAFRYSPIVKYVLYPHSTDQIFLLNHEIVKKCGDKPFKFNCINQYNESQQAVIMEASSIINYKNEPKLYFVQGPPGTGKSHTIIGIINAIFARLTMYQKNFNEITQNQPNVTTSNFPIPNMNNFKLLICSPSNGGCDELTRRIKALKDTKYSNLSTLNKKDFTIVRVGRSESIHKDSDDFNLDYLSKRKFEDLLRKKQCEKSSSLHEHFKTLQNTEITLVKKIKLLKSSSSANNEILVKEMENQLSELKKKKLNFENQLKKTGQNTTITAADRRKLDQQAKEMVLREADIVISTLNYCGNQLMDCLTTEKNGGNCIVNIIIIDEAAQCLEVESLIPLRFGCNKIIQVGDPEQLPATVLSKTAQNSGLGQSLFERVYQNFRFVENSPIKMLYVQYRMHPEICLFPSKNFYKGKLISDKDTLAKRTKQDLQPYLIYDIADGQEIGDENNGAIYNPKEADKVLEFCLMLISKKLNLSIGIITPYQQQVKYLKELFAKKQVDRIEIGTVDAYQGREKDIILFSSVRANSSNGSIGFLINRQRLNVSLTRAKFGLYIFCHVESLKVNEDWKNCIEDAQKRNLIRKNFK